MSCFFVQKQLSWFLCNSPCANLQQFLNAIYQCELHFPEQALSIDSDRLRLCLRIITHFITHITGVGLLLNGINKYITGNWLLFSHSHNENIIRDNRMDIVSNLLHLS